jgi:hypothetical protein
VNFALLLLLLLLREEATLLLLLLKSQTGKVPSGPCQMRAQQMYAETRTPLHYLSPPAAAQPPAAAAAAVV